AVGGRPDPRADARGADRGAEHPAGAARGAADRPRGARPAHHAQGPARPVTPPDAPDWPERGPARITPGNRHDVGLVGWGISRASGLVSGTTPPNLFLTLGRHRPLFRGWLRF